MTSLSQYCLTVAIGVGCLHWSSLSIGADFDLVIMQGRVMDPETQFDQVTNVGIRNGVIAAITADTISGRRSIDATGLVVSPGFIDGHFHAVDRLATKLAVQDGVTTGMDLETGSSEVATWYANREAAGWQMNYGTTASLGVTRMMVHDPEVDFSIPVDASILGAYIDEAGRDGTNGWSVSRSNVEEMNEIISLLDEDLRQGALGIGVGLAYMQKGVSSYEQFEVQRAAARYGRLTSVHTRYHLNSQPPNESPIALDEVLANSMLLNAPLILCHDNDYGWWENQEKLQLARDQGYNVWGEYYPFTAGSTFISAGFLKPETWENLYGYRYEETLYDPGLNKFLTREDYLKTVAEDPGRVIVVHMPARKEWLKYWLTIPNMVVGSDAMMGFDEHGNLLPYEAHPEEYAGHPRTVSSYARTLMLAREQGVPLMFTLAQLSYWSAKHLGDAGIVAMQERGRLQEGKIADITIFDPRTVAPRATYKARENGLTSAGIPWVIINGEIVVEDSQVLDVKPGQPIRYPVEAKGRYEEVSWSSWLEAHSIFSLTDSSLETNQADPRD